MYAAYSVCRIVNLPFEGQNSCSLFQGQNSCSLNDKIRLLPPREHTASPLQARLVSSFNLVLDRLCGQSFWLQIHRSWVRFPALPDFLRSSGSGTGSTQPREDNRRATLKK
jgi:hypothetical protein